MELIKAYSFAGFVAVLGIYGYDSSMTESGPFIAGYIGAALPAILGIGLYAVGFLNGRN